MKFLRIFQAIVALSIIGVMLLWAPPLTHGASAPAMIDTSGTNQYYQSAVNNLRNKYGLPGVSIDDKLIVSSNNKVNDMINRHYWAHTSPNGTPFSTFVWQADNRANHSGENLTRCFKSRDEAFKALVASPTHFAVMTGDFTAIGVTESVEPDTGCVITAMHFSRH